MVLKTELCRFSGAKIYPGRGIRFIRSDSQVFLFVNSKCKRYFHNRLRPAKLTWTAVYRKQHKKDIAAETVKKRRRTTKKPYSRSIVGATLEVIQKKRAEKPEVRDAAREAALREIKERIKKTKDEKKAKKAEVTSKAKTSKGGNVPKGAVPKGPKLGGGGLYTMNSTAMVGEGSSTIPSENPPSDKEQEYMQVFCVPYGLVVRATVNGSIMADPNSIKDSAGEQGVALEINKGSF
ncbi:60S ribosomal protein L24 [Forsythia ovata]|uniref:60S ribosomal protein L24 n=1 Tax=Forsythia ovata TaxID=205694 RepID=A0ABD1W1V3_9LAMI